MTVTKTWPSGTSNPTPSTYNIPEAGEKNWSSLTNFLSALADGTQATTFQKIAIRQAVTTPITIATNDCLVASKLTVPGAVAVNLPAGVAKQVFYIYDESGDASTNNITVNRSGTDTIEGATSFVVSTDKELIGLAFDATSGDWKVFLRAKPNIDVGSISGLGSGVAAWLADPTSAKLATAVADETGTGLLVFNNAATLVAPVLGTPASGNLGNCTNIPISELSGSTTGAGALVFATSPTLVTPNLGTPSAGSLDNCTNLPLTSGVTGILPVANGGTNASGATAAFDNLAPTTTKGDIVARNSSNNARLPVGADGLILKADSTTSTGLVWGSAAAGTGEVNYIENPDAEANTAGWATYADAAGSTPVDGTGGSPSVTWTRQSSVVLRGNQSFKLTKDAANRQGEGVSYDFSIKEQDTSKKLKLQFDFKTNEDAAYANGDLTVYIYDVTNADLIPPVDTGIISGQNIFQTSFVSTASTSYRLIFHIATTNASAWDAYVDNVIVGPGMTSQGAAIGPWTTITDSSISNLTTQIEAQGGFYARTGESIHVRCSLEFSGANGQGVVIPIIPESLTADTSKMLGSGFGTGGEDRVIIGVWYFRDASAAATYSGSVAYDVSVDQINFMASDGTNNLVDTSINIPVTIADGDMFSWEYNLPVLQYVGKGIVPMLAEDNLSEWTAFTPTGSWTTNTTYTGLYRRVGDTAEFQYVVTTSGIPDATTLTLDLPPNMTMAPLEASSTNRSLGLINKPGAQGFMRYESSTSFRPQFYLDSGTSETGANLNNTNGASTTIVCNTLSIPISEWAGSQNSLVGYSLADANNAGLLKSYEEFSTSLDNDFSGGTVHGVRIGKLVTLTVTGAAWTNDNSLLSSSGIVPSNFQPIKEILNVSGVESSRAILCRVSTAGQLILDIRTSSDLDVAASAGTDGTDVDARDFAISYVIY